jgi:hypothetical protein
MEARIGIDDARSGPLDEVIEYGAGLEILAFELQRHRIAESSGHHGLDRLRILVHEVGERLSSVETEVGRISERNLTEKAVIGRKVELTKLPSEVVRERNFVRPEAEKRAAVDAGRGCAP